MLSVLVLLVSCVVMGGAQAHIDDNWTWPALPECGPNEVLNECANACKAEDSCYDQNSIVCPAYFQPCQPACVCKEGFIRKTMSRECIPVDQCEGPCEIFTWYTDCKQVSKEVCPSAANQLKSNDGEGICSGGCECIYGYYRADENSPCRHRCLCPELRNTAECEWFWRNSA